MNDYFTLFSNCFLVKGYNQSIIFDSQRMKTISIPNDLYDVIQKSKNLPLNQIYAEYGDDNRETIEEYFESLVKNELGFLSSKEEKKLFPEMNTNYQSPFDITNSVLEEIRDIKLFRNVIFQLEELGCQYIEMVYYSKISNKMLENLLDCFSKASIKYIGLIIKYDNEKSNKFLERLSSQYLRINKILVHSLPNEKQPENFSNNFTEIMFSKTNFTNFSFCGNVNKNFFSPTLEHYTESINHNSCLNRKISIDSKGDIKNCPAMNKGFGNIKKKYLKDAFNISDFRQFWNISKDQISVCKDCEFRYICTDCRAYTEDPEDYYSKPLKCGYDPYTSKWEEWSTNPLKQKAIDYYGIK